MIEIDGTGSKGKKRIVAADADISARMELGAALADNDPAAVNVRAAVHLDAKILRVRITSVAS